MDPVRAFANTKRAGLLIPHSVFSGGFHTWIISLRPHKMRKLHLALHCQPDLLRIVLYTNGAMFVTCSRVIPLSHIRVRTGKFRPRESRVLVDLTIPRIVPQFYVELLGNSRRYGPWASNLPFCVICCPTWTTAKRLRHPRPPGTRTRTLEQSPSGSLDMNGQFIMSTQTVWRCFRVCSPKNERTEYTGCKSCSYQESSGAAWAWDHRDFPN